MGCGLWAGSSLRFACTSALACSMQVIDNGVGCPGKWATVGLTGLSMVEGPSSPGMPHLFTATFRQGGYDA